MSGITLFLVVMLIVQVCRMVMGLWFLANYGYPRRPAERKPIEDALSAIGGLCFALWAAYLLWVV